MEQYVSYYESPLGLITLAASEETLIGLWFDKQKHFGATLKAPPKPQERHVFKLAKEWLDCYFSGQAPDFIPPLTMLDSDFRCLVWTILLSIPYGCTTTYGEIAKTAAEKQNKPHMSAQAVGGAVGHNPISLIIPCHRVIGAKGNLTGYAGGLARKQWLLEHEGLNLRHK